MRRNAEKAADYARRHKVPKHYTNAEELIADNDVDAVYIATPPDSHKEYALKVAAAGKPCCIEKPLAPSYEDSKVILETFQKKELPLFVAYYRRTLPRFLKVKEWLDNGKIGEVRHVNWMLSKTPSEVDKNGEHNWRTDASVAPGGYFDDLASHGLDLFAYLFGNFKEVYGISLNQQGLYTAKDAMSGTWLHENGITGTGAWNFGCDRREDLVEVYGSKGKISFAVFEDQEVVLMNESGTTKEFIEHPKHVQQFHVEALKNDFFIIEPTPLPEKRLRIPVG